jgi:hypothetical protein
VRDLSLGARERDRRSIFLSAPDGLRLHVCEYGQTAISTPPVVCLLGLARTTADFDELAPALAYGDPRRRVVAISILAGAVNPDLMSIRKTTISPSNSPMSSRF